MRLSLIFSFFSRECLNGHDPAANFDVDRAVIAVSPIMQHLLSVGLMFYWVLVLRASLSAFQEVMTVYVTISGLWVTPGMVAMRLLAPYRQKYQHWSILKRCKPQPLWISVGHLKECWHKCLSLILSRGLFFIYREISYSKITGTIPSQMSALVKLEMLWALTSFFYIAAF